MASKVLPVLALLLAATFLVNCDENPEANPQQEDPSSGPPATTGGGGGSYIGYDQMTGSSGYGQASWSSNGNGGSGGSYYFVYPAGQNDGARGWIPPHRHYRCRWGCCAPPGFYYGGCFRCCTPWEWRYGYGYWP
ncbi:hypothetical protein GUJ93_ZPchr0006g42888 [Zizania palustris]|uniref:Glycine-rich protein n=1 Tax=Zizania palustris TaxID=103762 RepID=A0A8J5VTJ6_ZIZPA|nr:hypothetical protein GUJ93_ZPchr0006g42888 [Zizania palustris]